MIHFTKQDGQFKPISKSDLETWEKLKEGKVYAMRYKSDRNYKHHCKLFAIARMIIDNESEESIWNNKTEYSLIKATEIELGYVNEIVRFNGEIDLEPESINFETWGQEKFEKFYTDAINYWSKHFGYDVEAMDFYSNDYL